LLWQLVRRFIMEDACPSFVEDHGADTLDALLARLFDMHGPTWLEAYRAPEDNVSTLQADVLGPVRRALKPYTTPSYNDPKRATSDPQSDEDMDGLGEPVSKQFKPHTAGPFPCSSRSGGPARGAAP
jgi:hypothetical protein